MVVQFKTAARCKFCQSEHRSEIDAILERRAKGETDAAGVRINLERALEMIAALGVENPTNDNIKSHWGANEAKVHSYFTTESLGVKAAEEASADEAEAQLVRRSIIEQVIPGFLDKPRPVTPDEVAQVLQAISIYKTAKAFVSGDKDGVTVDHALKGGDLATKRNANDAAVELMKMAGYAIGGAVQASLERGEKRPALEQQNAVDAEFVEVE